METAPGEEAELMGVGGCEGGCCEPPIPPGIVGPPSGPSLWGLGVTERSSPEAVEQSRVRDGILWGLGYVPISSNTFGSQEKYIQKPQRRWLGSHKCFFHIHGVEVPNYY